MKKVSKILGTLMLVTLSFSCSTVKVTDSWNGLETPNIENKNVMVIGRTEDDVARVQFESDIVQSLEQNHVQSLESFKLFPQLKMNQKLEDIELKEVKRTLKKEGVDVVLMTSLKEVQEYEKTINSGTTDYVYTYPVIYRRGYFRGFRGYYNSIYINSGSVESITSLGKKYIRETVLYDLTQGEEDQLLSVITTVIDNPESLGTTSKDFSKKLVKELVK